MSIEDNSHAGQGAVMLDVGGDVGAVVVTMPAGTEGLEIEIRPVGETHRAVFGTDGHEDQHHPHDDAHPHHDAHRHPHDHAHPHPDGHPAADDAAGGHVHPWPHVGVVARPVDGRRQPSAVFGEVVEGRYDLYVRPHGPVRLTVDVVGGTVTHAVWPA